MSRKSLKGLDWWGDHAVAAVTSVILAGSPIVAAADRLVTDSHAAGEGRVERRDTFKLKLDKSTVIRHPNGFLDVWGVATRSGVFIYDDEQTPGGIIREFRPPEEVENEDSLASLKGAPFTIQHPDGEVTSSNATVLTHGWVLDVKVVGDLVWTQIRMASVDSQDVADSGTVELSCGYSARLVDGRGISPNGEAFDATQRDIRYNHLALVDLARAGHVARLHLDGFRVQRRDQAATKANTMKKFTIRIDGKTFKLPALLMPGISAMSTAERDDKIATGQVSITPEGGETTELVIPMAGIEQILEMLGASEAPAPASGPADPGTSQGGDQAHPPGAPAAGPPAAGMPGEEEKETDRADAAAKVALLVKSGIADAFKTRDIADKARAEVERGAVLILDSGYIYSEADTFQVMLDSIVKVDENDKERATKLADAARKGDLRAAGRLDGLFDGALKAARDADDQSGDLLKTLDAIGEKRGNGKAKIVNKVDDARKRRMDRVDARSRGLDPDKVGEQQAKTA